MRFSFDLALQLKDVAQILAGSGRQGRHCTQKLQQGCHLCSPTWHTHVPHPSPISNHAFSHREPARALLGTTSRSHSSIVTGFLHEGQRNLHLPMHHIFAGCRNQGHLIGTVQEDLGQHSWCDPNHMGRYQPANPAQNQPRTFRPQPHHREVPNTPQPGRCLPTVTGCGIFSCKLSIPGGCPSPHGQAFGWQGTAGGAGALLFLTLFLPRSFSWHHLVVAGMAMPLVANGLGYP